MSLGLLAMGTVLWLPIMVVLTACNVSFIVVALKNLEDPFNEVTLKVHAISSAAPFPCHAMPPTHPRTHARTHSLTHSLTHPPTHLPTQGLFPAL